MTVAQKILQHVKKLPERLQAQVLDFVEFLESKSAGQELSSDEEVWLQFSLSQAMRGMESEDSPYSEDDLKEVFE